MFTLRNGKLFALSCLIVFSPTQFVHSDPAPETQIVQIFGRRRAVMQELQEQQEARQAQTRAMANKPPAAPPIQRNAVAAVEAQPPADGVKVDPLLQLAERAIMKTSMRYLDADQHTPWQIMHGMVALRGDFVLTRGDEQINCVEFISNAPTFRGEHWWQVTKHGGRAHPFSVPYAFEGHINQFLALLSMTNLPLTHEFNVDGTHKVTMADMVENAKMTATTREEITWTLWFLTHYIDIDSEWVNESGEPWSIEELVRLQTKAPVVNAPCGGCHGLFAIAYARNAYLQKHGRLHGVYFQAEQKINQHIELARSMQNRDGSMSTEFFKGTGYSRDFNERLKSSGHMLEWLMMALPQQRLQEPWVRRAIASLSTDLVHNASKPAECGPLYHSLNALIMYRDRVKPQTTPAAEPPALADVEADDTAGEPVVIAPKSAREPETITGAPAELPTLVAPGREDQDSPVAANQPVLQPQVEEPALQPTPRIQAARPTNRLTPLPNRRLTQKAAERLAARVRDSQQSTSPVVAQPESPPLLRSPFGRRTRMAIEPQDRPIR